MAAPLGHMDFGSLGPIGDVAEFPKDYGLPSEDVFKMAVAASTDLAWLAVGIGNGIGGPRSYQGYALAVWWLRCELFSWIAAICQGKTVALAFGWLTDGVCVLPGSRDESKDI